MSPPPPLPSETRGRLVRYHMQLGPGKKYVTDDHWFLTKQRRRLEQPGIVITRMSLTTCDRWGQKLNMIYAPPPFLPVCAKTTRKQPKPDRFNRLTIMLVQPDGQSKRLEYGPRFCCYFLRDEYVPPFIVNYSRIFLG